MSVLGRARLRTLRNVYGVGSSTVGPIKNFFTPPAHLCAVICMTEISLIVTLNNQFTSPLTLIWSPALRVHSALNDLDFNEGCSFRNNG